MKKELKEKIDREYEEYRNLGKEEYRKKKGECEKRDRLMQKVECRKKESRVLKERK